MRKKLFWIIMVLLVTYLVVASMDKRELQEKVVRLHVVGASDSVADQELKLRVRDAVLERLEEALEGAEDKTQVLDRIGAMEEELVRTADQVLMRYGSEDRATVSVGQESFPRRDYDTFRLPAGTYDALRITIGDGQGKNWWCVVFPELCVPRATEQVDAVAAGAGFSDGTRGAMTGKYEIRFYVLDLLGRLENFFRSS